MFVLDRGVTTEPTALDRQAGSRYLQLVIVAVGPERSDLIG